MATQEQKLNPYFVDDLQSIIERQDADKIQENYSPLLINISLDRPGTWIKRKGSSLLSGTQAGNGVYGLVTYKKNDDTNVLRAVRSTDLDKYVTSWTALDTAQFTASTFVSSTNYLNRVYHISPSDLLCYESGSTCTDVGTGDDRIKANQVVTTQDTLFVCGVSYGVGAAQTWQDRIYYSLFDTANNIASHQLWEDAEGDLTSSTRFFTLLTPHKASVVFNGLSYHFTADRCFEFDITTTSVKEVFNIGCAGPRAVTECNGWLIWMSPDGRIWGWGGAGQPMPMSWAIEDDVNGEAIINKISASNISAVSAGSLGNKFYFSVGGITVYNETISNAVIVGLLTQNLDNVLFSIYSYPYEPQIWANIKISNKESLVFGSSGVDDVFQVETGVNDGSTAISAKAKTSMLGFDSPLLNKDFEHLLVRFRPQSSSDTFLKVKYAIDGETAYTVLSDPDNSVTGAGKIDMYDSSSTKRSLTKILKFPQEASGQLLSLEFSNDQLNESFEISGFGIKYPDVSPINIQLDS